MTSGTSLSRMEDAAHDGPATPDISLGKLLERLRGGRHRSEAAAGATCVRGGAAMDMSAACCCLCAHALMCVYVTRH